MLEKEMHNYFFEMNGQRMFLFKSQFIFTTDMTCLNHFEKGLKAGIFKLDISNVIQLWSFSGLVLWGLIGRTKPVDLVRILSANGGQIKANGDQFKEEVTLASLYRPVQYQISMTASEFQIVEPILNIQLKPRSGIRVNPFLFLEDKLILGSYYLEEGKDADFSFPVYCHSLEMENCFSKDAIRLLLAKLFYLGFKVEAVCDEGISVLAEFNSTTQSLKGISCEQTLFYVGWAEKFY